jgi:hypothetical protein
MTPFRKAGDILGVEHVVQGVVERAEVGQDFLAQVAGQEAERLAGLDGRAGEDDALHLVLSRAEMAAAMAR